MIIESEDRYLSDAVLSEVVCGGLDTVVHIDKLFLSERCGAVFQKLQYKDEVSVVTSVICPPKQIAIIESCSAIKARFYETAKDITIASTILSITEMNILSRVKKKVGDLTCLDCDGKTSPSEINSILCPFCGSRTFLATKFNKTNILESWKNYNELNTEIDALAGFIDLTAKTFVKSINDCGETVLYKHHVAFRSTTRRTF